MTKPQLHGLLPAFRLELHQCQSLKIDPAISLLCASDWSSPSHLAAAYLKQHGTTEVNPRKVLSAFSNSFNNICRKRRKHLALCVYCKELREYMTEPALKSQFAEQYTEQRLDILASKSGYSNAKRLAILGGQTYKNELEQKIENVEGSSPLLANINSITTPTTSTATSTTADKRSILGKHERDHIYSEVDYDGNENERLSVGTVLKRQAILNHDKFQQGAKLSASERKAMSCGLSSILDLVDLSQTGQGSLFPEHGLDHVKATMMKKYAAKSYALPPKVEEIWNIMVKLSKRDNTLESTSRYLSKIKASSPRFVHVFETMINILETQKSVLNKGKVSSRLTEYDYLLKLWGPLLESILAINGGIVRLKSGESINSNTTQMKRELYDSESTLGFKIDLRFVFDGDDDEYDVGAGEVAKYSAEGKLNHDLGKLLREGKDVLDGMLNLALDPTTVKKSSAWMIQICGLQGEVSSLHLAQDGLYVAVPQFKCAFPSSISTMGSFINTLQSLVTFVTMMESRAHEIKRTIEELETRRLSIGKKFGRPRLPLPGHQMTFWMRPTWYSPSRNQGHLSRLPAGLFRDLMEGGQDEINSTRSPDGRDDDSDGHGTAIDVDEFGWCHKSDGRWYNNLTGAWTDICPY